MKIAVIGAGVAGLASARRCLENGFEVVVYERSTRVGGTWVYDERVGLDEFGLPIHTSMYQNLMTNLPKELMDFPDFPYKGLDDVSFLKSQQVQKYIEQFTEHFGLNKYIRFCHLVTAVERLADAWRVSFEDLTTKTSVVAAARYDAVIVCNGHNSMPNMPVIPAMDRYAGVVIHSHDYRAPERFRDADVLVVGAGPSGIDICWDVAGVASRVYFSHHNPKLLDQTFPSNVVHKPDVECFSEKSVYFKDKTVQTLDAVIYCTGFKITLPFLKPSCGINVIDDSLITPLHKNIVNMNNCTMGFIGFLNRTFVHRVFDLQVRYYLTFLRKNDRSSTTMTAVNTHFVGDCLNDYCKSLMQEEVKIEPIPRILFNVYSETAKLRERYNRTYHTALFKIIDDDNYVIEFDENNAKNK